MFSPENRYFQKFWFEILKNDAHNGDWKKYPVTKHPEFGHKITTLCMVAKLISKKDIRVEGIFHPSKMHWVTNLDDTLHLHMDTTWAFCHHALTKTECLNKEILSEIVPSAPEVYRQQWPHEDHWEMSNPYDNHDPDVDVDIDEEWFQGRDGWDSIA